MMNIFIFVKHKFSREKATDVFLRLPQTDILDLITVFLGKFLHVIKSDMG